MVSVKVRIITGITLWAALISSPAKAGVQELTDPASLREISFEDLRVKESVNVSRADGVYLVADRESAAVRRIHFSQYSARGRADTAAVPIVFIIPPIVGRNVLDDFLALSLVNAGFSAVVIEPDSRFLDPERPLEDYQRALLDNIRDARAVIQRFTRYPGGWKRRKAGVLGVSLGGILATALLGTEPALSAGFVSIAGTGLPKILAESEQEDAKALREGLMRRLGTPTREEFEQRVSRLLDLDLGALARAARDQHKKIEQWISLEDTAVPTPLQLELWEDFGRPSRKLNHTGHLATALKLFVRSPAPVEFFRRAF